MADKKDKKEKKPKKEKTIDFKKISKNLNDLEEKQQVDQIGPSIVDVYAQHAKYEDEKGVIHFKTKFEVEEAESLGDKVYDALVYHAHRRLFNIDEGKYKELLKIKDANDTPYADVIARHYFKISRDELKKKLKDRADNEDPIDHTFLSKTLEDNIKHHVSLLNGEIVRDVGPEDMDALREQIKGLVKKHKLDPKISKRVDKIYDFEALVQNYIGLIHQYYQEDEEDAGAAAA